MDQLVGSTPDLESLDWGSNHPELGKIFALFAKETRNPLQSIWGALFVIRQRVDPRDEILARAVRIVSEETKELQGLVQEYLDFVRPVEGKRMAAVDLNALLICLLKALEHNRKGSSLPLSVTTSLDPALPHPAVDYEEIKRAFGYILRNLCAVLSEKGGALDVETRFSPLSVPGSIVVAFTISGAVVAGGDFDRALAPFDGFSPGRKGLGVAIGHRIIREGCRGDLRAECIDGKSLCIRVSLPVKG